MKKPIVIQILGLARSGKDWTAKELKTYFESQGKSVKIMSYAEPLKQILSKTLQVNLKELEELKNSNKSALMSYKKKFFKFFVNINFRKAHQFLGEEIKAQFGNSIWVDFLKTKIKNSNADIIIIPDCRFLIELKTIGGTTIRVVNNNIIPMNHSSETELLEVSTDLLLQNTDKSATTEDVKLIAERILNESNL